MKLSTVAIPAAIALLAHAEADAPQFKPFDKSQLATSSFFEQFDSDDWAQLWKISKAKKDDEFSYVGQWEVEEPTVFPGYKGDKGLVLKTKAAHHAIHASLPETFDNKDDTFVLQYEVKLQKGLSCSGAYVKLLSQDGAPSDSSEFNNDTPYQVMFGPDKCGTTNKVHFIIRRKNPHTGEYEEKHLVSNPVASSVKTTNLYTLIIEPNQDFQIRMNSQVMKAGNLLDDGAFKPSFDPPAEVDDVNDVKPEDWDERPTIPDPDQSEKPEDWDENAPYMIEDPAAVIPEDWSESTPQYIPDPEAEKPEDWDDEEDGEWEAPTIYNPECDEHGCGPWEKPLIQNPEYKGKWTQPLIENPAYQGTWKPRQIANPDFYHDDHPSDLEPIGAIGFELWSMDGDMLFDNIYLGHSIDEAELIGNVTYLPKFELEQQSVLAFEPAKDDSETPVTEKQESKIESAEDSEDLFTKAQNFLEEFLANPAETLSTKPAEAAIYAGAAVFAATLVLSVLSLVLGAITGAPSEPAKKAEKEVEEPVVIDVSDDKEEKETVASGVTKRETRASKRTA